MTLAPELGGGGELSIKTGPPDLVTIDDPDWAKFQNKDPEYYLHAASEAVRDYCGWHIFPALDLTVDKLRIGSWSKIILPSLMVNNVASVTIDLGDGNPQLLDPSTYTWFANGVIQPAGFCWWGQPASVPIYQRGLASVSFNSGFPECPPAIKEVIFEVADAAPDMAALGNVKEIDTPGFKLMLGEGGGGMTLGKGQKNVLAQYRVGGFTAGIV